MIKLLALDMDGTLFNEAKEIPQDHTPYSPSYRKRGQSGSLYRVRPLFGVLPYY